MRRPQTPRPPLTEANRTSQTRFGPRPVPTGQPVPQQGGAHDTSTVAKAVVWAGVALGMVGVTAAAAILARKLAGTDDDRLPVHHQSAHRQSVAPRFAHLEEEEREAMRRRVRAQAHEDSAQKARLRASASRGRSGNFAKDLTRTATDLSEGLNGVAQSLTSAFQAFRGVSSQATTIVGDFVAAADQLRGIMNGPSRPHPRAAEDRPRADDTRI